MAQQCEGGIREKGKDGHCRSNTNAATEDVMRGRIGSKRDEAEASKRVQIVLGMPRAKTNNSHAKITIGGRGRPNCKAGQPNMRQESIQKIILDHRGEGECLHPPQN